MLGIVLNMLLHIFSCKIALSFPVVLPTLKTLTNENILNLF